MIKESLQIPQPVIGLEKEAGGIGTNALHGQKPPEGHRGLQRCAEEPWELSYAQVNEAETGWKVGCGMSRGALKVDEAGVGNQQTNQTHWRRGLGPGGQLEGGVRQ